MPISLMIGCGTDGLSRHSTGRDPKPVPILPLFGKSLSSSYSIYMDSSRYSQQ